MQSATVIAGTLVLCLVAGGQGFLVSPSLPGVSEEAAHFSDDASKGKTSLPPVVFVPGLTSCAIFAELHNSPSIFGCPKTTKNRIQVWPVANINSTQDYLCFLEHLSLQYNSTTKTFGNKPGEKTFLQDYGGFDGVRGYGPVVKAMTDLGYIVGKNLFGVPFDWRGPASAFPRFHSNLTKLVEHAYATNGQRKVSIISVSYGPQFALSFLHGKSQAWKDKYINWFVAESPVWSGAPGSVLAVTSGYDPSSPERLLFTRQVSIATFSDAWLLPRRGNTSSTWSTDEVLASTPSRNYTSGNYHQLYADLGFEHLVPGVTRAIEDADLEDFKHPGVNTFVTYGFDIDTPGSFVWDQDFVHNVTGGPPFPHIINATDKGDSIVPLRSSLRGWDEWRTPMKKAEKTLLYKGYRKQQHGYCLAPLEGDGCFHEVFNLIVNGTAPPNADKA